MSDVVEVPYQQLSEHALQGLIEEFINREGTDYGAQEYSLEGKVAQVHQALQVGRAVIVFDPVLESCTLLSKT
ncbi:YheU family protein [Dasania marina]|uniref:YheU family protein n=1 Tax=Dasania marina TaxID=471499 RepID=UPI00035CB134|nr:YheU family protein [Dasania marina]|tara:strand:+ start:57546 stop:57764 length:219 start_codon:yes stop_codon:yes gene_type:complete